MKNKSKVVQIAYEVEKNNLVDQILKANSAWHVIWIGLVSGIAKGVGFTIGATLILVILFRILVAITKLNIPYIQGFLQDTVNVIASSPAVEKIIQQEREISKEKN